MNWSKLKHYTSTELKVFLNKLSNIKVETKEEQEAINKGIAALKVFSLLTQDIEMIKNNCEDYDAKAVELINYCIKLFEIYSLKLENE